MMVRLNSSLMVFLILVSAFYVVQCTLNKTLVSEGDLLKIQFDDNRDANSAEKSKRDLPKVQSVVINVLKPIPIVDTIKEEEKYGNTGDKFNKVGRSIVNGVEKMANVVNSLINFPMEAVKKLSRSATEALNNLGGKLVGLQ